MEGSEGKTRKETRIEGKKGKEEKQERRGEEERRGEKRRTTRDV